MNALILSGKLADLKHRRSALLHVINHIKSVKDLEIERDELLRILDETNSEIERITETLKNMEVSR